MAPVIAPTMNSTTAPASHLLIFALALGETGQRGIRATTWTGSAADGQKILREQSGLGLLLGGPLRGSTGEQADAVPFDVAVHRLQHRAVEKPDPVFQAGRRRQHAGDGQGTFDL